MPSTTTGPRCSCHLLEPPTEPVARSRVLLLVATALMLTLALSGCGRSAETGSKKGDAKLGAAEPSTAPKPTEAPAGTTTDVASRPQGIAFDATTDTLAVAVRDPYRLLLLDPTTIKIRRTVTLPGKARHLQIARPGGPVLVPVETADMLIQVPLDGGPTVQTKVQRHPHDATGATDGDDFVINEFSGSLSRVRDGKDIANNADLKQPGGVVADGDTIAVVDVGSFTLNTFDAKTLKRIGQLPAGAGPTHGALVASNRYVVIDTRGGQLISYSLSPLKRLGSVDLAGTGPYGVAADASTETLWVTLTAKNMLVGYDYSTGTPHKIAEYPTVQQPNTVAVAPGSKTLWVTGTDGEGIQRITR